MKILRVYYLIQNIYQMRKNRLEFDVILDQDKNPVKIVMNSSDQQAVDV